MERENRDDTAGGGESETQPVISSVRDDKEDELEGSAAKTKSDSVNEPGEAEHPEQNDTTTGGESEIKSLPSTTKERGLQSGFVTLPRLSRLDRQCQDGDAQKGSLPDGGGSIALKHSDSLTSFTVDLGPSLMTEVLSLIDNPSCLQMSNHSQAAGEEDERGDEEDEDDSSLSETPVQSPGVTSPSPSFSRSMNNRGRSCSSNWTEQEEDRRSLRTPDASAGSPQRAEPVMEAERFQRAADVLSRHYGGESFTKGTRVNNNTPSPAVSYSRKTSYAFSEEEEEIKV
ncbi:cdc42 effector protein 4-like isoform X6 [Trachinotus anak]|uniref:cdc42 effector protein 4-like isoform X6 n=1 Tax=Trachinotus anak TaxID=443729 RepID=UPI0039F21EA1